MSIGSRTSQLFGLTIFGLCQWPAIEPYTVPMSAKPSTLRPPPSGNTPLEVVHLRHPRGPQLRGRRELFVHEEYLLPTLHDR